MAYYRPGRGAAVLAPLGALPGAAAGNARVEPLWLASAAPAGLEAPMLLSLPPGWAPGDAAALVFGDGPESGGARDRLVAALLRENTAVLEMDARTAREAPRDGAVAPAPRDLLPAFSAALLALRRDAGAGVVVALGYGAGGGAALSAADETAVAGHLGPAGPRFAAAAALGPGRPAAFALGTAPPPEAAWPVRVPLLCAALSALAGPPGPASRGGTATDAAGRDCTAALAPPPALPGPAPGTARPGQER